MASIHLDYKLISEVDPVARALHFQPTDWEFKPSRQKRGKGHSGAISIYLHTSIICLIGKRNKYTQTHIHTNIHTHTYTYNCRLKFLQNSYRGSDLSLAVTQVSVDSNKISFLNNKEAIIFLHYWSRIKLSERELSPLHLLDANSYSAKVKINF